MYSCDHDDAIVVHEKFDCPLCVADASIADYEKDVERLELEIETLKDEADE